MQISREGSGLSSRHNAMTTAGQLANKISELRSKIAVISAVIQYITANYMPSRDKQKIPPEMFFTREDGAAVGSNHVVLCVDDFDAQRTQLQAELEELENTPVGEAVSNGTNGIHTKKSKKEKKPDAVQSRNQDRSAS